ncbi:MAG: tungstate transport system permease protein [Clostridiales bacterium]|jgi:tungstate transport system permease protein|nr:tungstate transport system permease protein [Clostridiales bacterium]
MTYFLDSFKEAISLLTTFDQEVYGIIVLSLFVSFSSTVVATLIGVPSGLALGLNEFRGKAMLTRIIYTMMSLPTVVVGLTVAILLSRRGAFGSLELLYTPAAMVIAQTVLVTPIITGIVFNASKANGEEVKRVCKTLGGNSRDVIWLLVAELKINLLIAVVTGFGRAISEVGAVMIVGGNIKYHTRVMTTYIAMNNGMGNYSKALAMGLVLLLISFIVNTVLYHFGMEASDDH